MTDTVTEAAVEAAASAMWDHDRERWDDYDVIGKWDSQEAEVKASWRPLARAALEAALPLIVAGERARLLQEMADAACNEGAVLSARGFLRQFADDNEGEAG